MQITLHNSLSAAILVLTFSDEVFGQAAAQSFVSVTPCRIADTRTS